jgi:hypothetical protein
MRIDSIEKYFRQQEKVFGAYDPESFKMIFSLIEMNRQLREENDKLTALNRHYYHTFYNGNIDKMVQDFKYLME